MISAWIMKLEVLLLAQWHSEFDKNLFLFFFLRLLPHYFGKILLHAHEARDIFSFSLEKCAICGTACKYLALSSNAVSFSVTILFCFWYIESIQRIQWLWTESWGNSMSVPVVRAQFFHCRPGFNLVRKLKITKPHHAAPKETNA